MLYRKVPKTGDELSILGFGCMRLPSRTEGGIDEERAIRQIRSVIDAGVNYVDTAPAYHMGKSEKILARALADGYRERVRIATKLPPWSVHARQDMDRILDAQLATLATDRIDYYLLHSLGRASWERMRALGVTGFLDTAKRDGRIRNTGFSFHGNPAAFREIVDAYDWDFCQIQYNYLDEQNQAGTAGLRYAAERGLAVMVMEPLRGGNLAGAVPDPVRALWETAPARRTPAEWALRWIWDHPEVTVVLSGMNDEAHIAENLRVADEGLPHSLSEEELALVERVRETYHALMKVGCTGCGYCLPCPAGVDIPGCFSSYNDYHLFPGDRRITRFAYLGRHGGLMAGVSHAGLCKGCGACERRCPQSLAIRDRLGEVSREMGGPMLRAVPLLKAGLRCWSWAGRARRRVLRTRADA